MASSNFTSNLHLSAWTGSDRPKRADFVSDNNIIDTTLGGHIANSGIHVTADEKARIAEPYDVRIYAGSGESERTISVGFSPSFVIVYKRGVPPVAYSGGANVINSGYACYGHGSTTGLVLTSSGVVVTETSVNADGVRVSLNESGSQYTLIAFK